MASNDYGWPQGHGPWTLQQARPKPPTTGPDPRLDPLTTEQRLVEVMARTKLKLRQGLHDMGLDHDRISTIFEECDRSWIELDCDLFDAVLNRLE